MLLTYIFYSVPKISVDDNRRSRSRSTNRTIRIVLFSFFFRHSLNHSPTIHFTAFSYLTWRVMASCWVFRQALLCSHSVRRLHTAVRLNPLWIAPHTAAGLRLYSPNIRQPNLFEYMLSWHSSTATVNLSICRVNGWYIHGRSIWPSVQPFLLGWKQRTLQFLLVRRLRLMFPTGRT